MLLVEVRCPSRPIKRDTFSLQIHLQFGYQTNNNFNFSNFLKKKKIIFKMPRGGGLTQKHKVSNDMAAIIGKSSFYSNFLSYLDSNDLIFRIICVFLCIKLNHCFFSLCRQESGKPCRVC